MWTVVSDSQATDISSKNKNIRNWQHIVRIQIGEGPTFLRNWIQLGYWYRVNEKTTQTHIKWGLHLSQRHNNKNMQTIFERKKVFWENAKK